MLSSPDRTPWTTRLLVRNLGCHIGTRTTGYRQATKPCHTIMTLRSLVSNDDRRISRVMKANAYRQLSSMRCIFGWPTDHPAACCPNQSCLKCISNLYSVWRWSRDGLLCVGRRAVRARRRRRHPSSIQLSCLMLGLQDLRFNTSNLR